MHKTYSYILHCVSNILLCYKERVTSDISSYHHRQPARSGGFVVVSSSEISNFVRGVPDDRRRTDEKKEVPI
jgi:hypothetical protein